MLDPSSLFRHVWNLEVWKRSTFWCMKDVWRPSSHQERLNQNTLVPAKDLLSFHGVFSHVASPHA